MLVLLHQALHQHRARAVVLEELLHLGGQLFRGMAPDPVHAHGLREEDEIGVHHLRVRIALVIEEILTRRIH
jgi:hypothetical protein